MGRNGKRMGRNGKRMDEQEWNEDYGYGSFTVSCKRKGVNTKLACSLIDETVFFEDRFWQGVEWRIYGKRHSFRI